LARVTSKKKYGVYKKKDECRLYPLYYKRWGRFARFISRPPYTYHSAKDFQHTLVRARDRPAIFLCWWPVRLKRRKNIPFANCRH
jgi:hypothetical protein